MFWSMNQGLSLELYRGVRPLSCKVGGVSQVSGRAGGGTYEEVGNETVFEDTAEG